MARTKTKKLQIKSADIAGRIPEAIQYEALKSMSRTASVRDKKRRERKDAKQSARDPRNW